MQKIQKRQCDDVQWEHELECLGPKRNRVLGGGKRASERVNRRCDERLLEAVRLDVVTPGLAASEERHGAGRLRHNPRQTAAFSRGFPDPTEFQEYQLSSDARRAATSKKGEPATADSRD